MQIGMRRHGFVHRIEQVHCKYSFGTLFKMENDKHSFANQA